jgi:diacylglycerol kinase (ATP)
MTLLFSGADSDISTGAFYGNAMNDSHQVASEFKSKRGLKRILPAIFYALDGLKSAWTNEHAFRQELAVVIPGIVIALFCPVTALEKLMLIGVLVLVLIVELINSAIEATVDRVSLDRHPLSKNAKDLGSAAVFLALLFSGLTWLVILAPVVLPIFFSP